MKPEKTGRIEASTPRGGVIVAVMVSVWPGRTVTEMRLSLTVAAALERGTGPSLGKSVPYT